MYLFHTHLYLWPALCFLCHIWFLYLLRWLIKCTEKGKGSQLLSSIWVPTHIEAAGYIGSPGPNPPDFSPLFLSSSRGREKVYSTYLCTFSSFREFGAVPAHPFSSVALMFPLALAGPPLPFLGPPTGPGCLLDPKPPSGWEDSCRACCALLLHICSSIYRGALLNGSVDCTLSMEAFQASLVCTQSCVHQAGHCLGRVSLASDTVLTKHVLPCHFKCCCCLLLSCFVHMNTQMVSKLFHFCFRRFHPVLNLMHILNNVQVGRCIFFGTFMLVLWAGRFLFFKWAGLFLSP